MEVRALVTSGVSPPGAEIGITLFILINAKNAGIPAFQIKLRKEKLPPVAWR
jgi:hypothetical protein